MALNLDFMAVEGEGPILIIYFIGFLVLVIIAVLLYKRVKSHTSMYTYAYKRRGLSPVMSFVLILALTTLCAVAIYFWAAGSTGSPAYRDAPVPIQTSFINSTYVRIVNLGARDVGPYSVMPTSGGDCSFALPTTLKAGVPEMCTFAVAKSGVVKFYATEDTRSSQAEF